MPVATNTGDGLCPHFVDNYPYFRGALQVFRSIYKKFIAPPEYNTRYKLYIHMCLLSLGLRKSYSAIIILGFLGLLLFDNVTKP